MAQNVIHVRGGNASLRQALHDLPLIFAGRMSDPMGVVRGVQLRIGMVALSFIRLAFIAKSRGGVDEAGDSWKPLSKRYVAYGRRHPGLPPAKERMARKGRRYLLTKKQDDRWRQLFARQYGNLLRKEGISRREAKGGAAGYAWNQIKAEGGRTIIGEYGDRPVEILRDTGVLFNSLSPGVDGPSNATNQVFRTYPGFVIVGTNRKGASAHHNGRGVPQRRLWPEPSRWPAHWWLELVNQLRDGAMLVLRRQLGG